MLYCSVLILRGLHRADFVLRTVCDPLPISRVILGRLGSNRVKTGGGVGSVVFLRMFPYCFAAIAIPHLRQAQDSGFQKKRSFAPFAVNPLFSNYVHTG